MSVGDMSELGWYTRVEVGGITAVVEVACK